MAEFLPKTGFPGSDDEILDAIYDRSITAQQATARVSPNDRQVGGEHYKAGFQHWDLVAFNRMPYFEAQITKYITRWKKKNGAQDVEKSFHYLEKLLTLIEEKTLPLPKARPIVKLDVFAKENKLSVLERLIFQIVMSYTSVEELHTLRGYLEQLLEEAKAEQMRTKVAFVQK